jgi:hypothetical protein
MLRAKVKSSITRMQGGVIKQEIVKAFNKLTVIVSSVITNKTVETVFKLKLFNNFKDYLSLSLASVITYKILKGNKNVLLVKISINKVCNNS